MIGIFRGLSSALSKNCLFITKSATYETFVPSWKTNLQILNARAARSELLFPRLQLRCFSSKKSVGGSSRKRKLESEPAMKDEKDAFFVVRKGDLIGVYKSLSECQSQVGTSIHDPPVSVYKGYSMPKDTEKYLMSCGLKNALYSIRSSDLTEGLFGTLVACPCQPSSSSLEVSIELGSKKRSHASTCSEDGESIELMVGSKDAIPKHFKSDPPTHDQSKSVCQSCTIEFDGASKGNPGQAGAGAVLRSDDGNLICRLREGLGIATNNVAEYRAFILGIKYALSKGFTSIRVRGDSKLVCMQVQGLWKVKNQNISELYNEAKKLVDKCLQFEISHVLRDLNSEADAQANLAVDLAVGQIQVDVDK